MKKKKIVFLLTLLVALFLLNGCALPMKDGKIIQITNDTTFQYMMSEEGIFAAIFIYPLAKCINLLAPHIGVVLAIVVVTIGIHGIVLLFTWKSNVSQQKMQALQPEMVRIQKKYEGKDDQQSRIKMQQEISALYAKNGINMFGSLLVGFIQLPILIAVYHAVQRASSVASGHFLNMNMETSPLNGLKEGKVIYIFAFLTMIMIQIISLRVPQWLNEKRARKEAEMHFRRYEKPANPMGKSMYIMVLVVSSLLITWPVAMTIYYIISSLVMIAKTFFIDYVMRRRGNA